MEKNEKNEKNDYRVEKDSIGAKDVPENVYYGVQSLRAAENFHITGLTMHPEFINSLAYIKKAAAITNCEAGLLDKKIAAAIVKACDELSTAGCTITLSWIPFRRRGHVYEHERQRGHRQPRH